MIIPSFNVNNSSMNAVKAKVELYNGSTLVTTCTCGDVLQSFTVNRIGENNKFFGFGVCHKLDMVLIDLERKLSLTKGQTAETAFGDGTNFLYPYPTFYIDEVTRDENSNSISLVAYDKLYNAGAHFVEELELEAPYTLEDAARACAALLGLAGVSLPSEAFSTSYSEGANVDGSETVRVFLNAIAEATQTIYYINSNDLLVFKRLDINGEPVFTITKDDYFTLRTGEKVAISAVCHATELGNNVIAGDEAGIVQYVRDNPFWEKDDAAGNIAAVVEAALDVVTGLEINPFACDDWTGNYLIEIGDKIALVTEDNGNVISYVLNDTVTYDGTLAEATSWTYEPDDGETATNPTSLGDKLNQTFARVDKVNQEVTIAVTTSNANAESITALQDSAEGLAENFEALSKEVALKVSAEDVTISIERELSNGVEKVVTTNEFTFDEHGLNISKSDSEITTTITEDGMRVSRTGEEVLRADNEGVRAEDLHATTYLIIGNNSRLEDWNGRTACFWIGG